MKRICTNLLVVLMMISAAQFAFAQNYVKNVIVLNEGHYDYNNLIQTVPVTIGSYDPTTHIYAAFDTIHNARFGSCVVVDSNFIYAAADTFLIKYDRFTHARLNAQTVHGIRKIAVWNNQLLITRGEYLVNYLAYFQVYDKNSLSFIYQFDSLTGPGYSTEGIVVNNDTAYLAVNNGFNYGNEVGFIGKVNLNGQSYIGNINLDSTGKNPFSIATDGNTIYTVNNRDYSTASVSSLGIASGNLTTVGLATSSGCGASSLVTNYIYYQVSGDTVMNRFNTTSLTNYDTLHINKNIYGMAHDPINSLIYAGETDYVTFGKIFIYNLTGTLQDSFTVSVAPGNIALDVRSSAGINSLNNGMKVSVYPNPTTNNLHVEVIGIESNEIINCTITDVLGNVVKNINGTISSLNNISINDLAAGVYSISIRSEKGMVTNKIVKE